MNLEPIIQSEISQKEKRNKYFILAHILEMAEESEIKLPTSGGS